MIDLKVVEVVYAVATGIVAVVADTVGDDNEAELEEKDAAAAVQSIELATLVAV